MRCIWPSVFPGGAEETAKTLAHSVLVLSSDKGLDGSREAREKKEKKTAQKRKKKSNDDQSGIESILFSSFSPPSMWNPTEPRSLSGHLKAFICTV